MKIDLVFACCICLATASVRPWTPEGEEEALRLYRQLCSGYQDTGVIGDTQWFCKTPDEPGHVETFNHYQVITARPVRKKQIIFINTPSNTYRHNVLVKGQAGFEQETSIFVLPPKNRHEVDITGNVDTNTQINKPALFYVKDNPDGYNNHRPSYYPTTSRPASRPYYPTKSAYSNSNSFYSDPSSAYNNEKPSFSPPPSGSWRGYDDDLERLREAYAEAQALASTPKPMEIRYESGQEAASSSRKVFFDSLLANRISAHLRDAPRKRGFIRSTDNMKIRGIEKSTSLKTTSNGLFIFPN